MNWLASHPLLIAITLAISVVTLIILRLLFAYPPGKEDHNMLSAREQAFVAAAANTFFPPKGPIPLSGTEAGAIAYFDRYMQRSGTRERFLIRLLLLSVEWSPLLIGPQPRRFTRLDHARRLHFFQEMFTSAWYFRRVSFISLRAVLTMAYLSNEQVARHMGMVADRDPFGLDAGVNQQVAAS